MLKFTNVFNNLNINEKYKKGRDLHESINKNEVKYGFLKKVSNTFLEIIKDNKSLSKNFLNAPPKNCQEFGSIFYSKYKYPLPIEEYLERIFKIINLEESTVIMAMIFIDRICSDHKIFLSYFNIEK